MLMVSFLFVFMFTASSNIDLVCSTSYQSRTGLPYPLVGSAQDYGVNLIPNYITDLSCPADSSYADSSCNYTINSQSCAGYGGPSIVTCINGKLCVNLSEIYR